MYSYVYKSRKQTHEVLLFRLLRLYSSVRVSFSDCYRSSSVSKSLLIPRVRRFPGLLPGLFPVGRHSIAALILVVSAFRIA